MSEQGEKMEKEQKGFNAYTEIGERRVSYDYWVNYYLWQQNVMVTLDGSEPGGHHEFMRWEAMLRGQGVKASVVAPFDRCEPMELGVAFFFGHEDKLRPGDLVALGTPDAWWVARLIMCVPRVGKPFWWRTAPALALPGFVERFERRLLEKLAGSLVGPVGWEPLPLDMQLNMDVGRPGGDYHRVWVWNRGAAGHINLDGFYDEMVEDLKMDDEELQGSAAREQNPEFSLEKLHEAVRYAREMREQSRRMVGRTQMTLRVMGACAARAENDSTAGQVRFLAQDEVKRVINLAKCPGLEEICVKALDARAAFIAKYGREPDEVWLGNMERFKIEHEIGEPLGGSRLMNMEVRWMVESGVRVGLSVGLSVGG